jgi:hypothetical protein
MQVGMEAVVVVVVVFVLIKVAAVNGIGIVVSLFGLALEHATVV